MIDFIVHARPRSGTAWLSVWLDATHDPFGKMRPSEISGGVCCTLAAQVKWWLEDQRCPIVKVVRDRHEVDESLGRIGMAPLRPSWHDNFDASPGRVFAYGDVWSDIEAAYAMWTYLKDERFNEARWERLRAMRIQVRDPWAHDARLTQELIDSGRLLP